MLAALHHFSKGRIGKREYLEAYDDWYLLNVACRPNSVTDKNDTRYRPVPRLEPDDHRRVAVHDAGIRQMFMMTTGRAMRTMGCSEAEIEERFDRWSASYQGPEKLR